MNTSEPDDDLREVLKPTPASAPASIDAAIRAHARRALNTKPTSEKNKDKRSGGKLLRLLPIAAVVVLSIGLIPRLQQEPGSQLSAPMADALQSADEVAIDLLEGPSADAEESMAAESEIVSSGASLASSKMVRVPLREPGLPERQAIEAEAEAAFRTELSEEVSENVAPFAADSAPSVRAIKPEASLARLSESRALEETDDVPEPARTAAADILELLRTGSDGQAHAAYRRWREAWPQAEPVPKLKGMSDVERDWFERAAERLE